MFRICPYRARCGRACSHKTTKPNRGGKRICSYKYEHNCELFIEWYEKARKVSPKAFKTREEGMLEVE